MRYTVCVLHVHLKEESGKMYTYLHYQWFLYHFFNIILVTTCALHLLFSVLWVLRKVLSLALHASCSERKHFY